MAVKIDHQFSATAERLWEVLGKPDRVDWVPGVQRCVLEGDVRSLTLPGAGDIKERILFHSNEKKIIEYSCFEAPGALQTHHARMEVVPNPQGCQLLWQAEVTPAHIEAFIRNSMEGCLVRLEQLLDS
ncbi:MAG: SRPBCC family protein [Luminiphilus sp.]|nr:SRPBCC family protein [Luminiphilus sp.]